jgi:hypothetical protein
MSKKQQAPPELHNSGAITPNSSNGSNGSKDPTESAAAPPAPAPKRESPALEYLPVRYTDPERMDIAEQLGRAAQAQGDLEDQKKAQDAEYKESLEAVKLQIKRLSRKLGAGSEMRNVQCKWLLEDPTSKEKTLVRLDTGEVVRVLPMQDHDFQETLPIAAPTGTNGSGETLVLEPPPDGKTASAND